MKALASVSSAFSSLVARTSSTARSIQLRLASIRISRQSNYTRLVDPAIDPRRSGDGPTTLSNLKTLKEVKKQPDVVPGYSDLSQLIGNNSKKFAVQLTAVQSSKAKLLPHDLKQLIKSAIIFQDVDCVIALIKQGAQLTDNDLKSIHMSGLDQTKSPRDLALTAAAARILLKDSPVTLQKENEFNTNNALIQKHLSLATAIYNRCVEEAGLPQ